MGRRLLSEGAVGNDTGVASGTSIGAAVKQQAVLRDYALALRSGEAR